jgi:hypothetical protein
MKNDKKVALGQNAKDYLQSNKVRGLGNGLTIGTWVGRIKGYNRWSWRIEGVIFHQIASNPKKAFEFTSAKGRKAYYPTSMLKGENKKKYLLILTLVKLDPTIEIHQLTKKMFGENE